MNSAHPKEAADTIALSDAPRRRRTRPMAAAASQLAAGVPPPSNHTPFSKDGTTAAVSAPRARSKMGATPTRDPSARAADEAMRSTSNVGPPPQSTHGFDGIDLLGFQRLRVWAESFYDVQEARKACLNRVGHGGLPRDVFAPLEHGLIALERDVARELRRCYRAVAPPGVLAWQRDVKGIGEHLLARLLGHLGPPRLAMPYAWTREPPADHMCGPSCGDARHLVAQRPYWRTVAQLRSYCGVGDPMRRRATGLNAEETLALGSPTLKMLLWNLASAAIKTRSVADGHDAPALHQNRAAGHQRTDDQGAGADGQTTRDDQHPTAVGHSPPASHGQSAAGAAMPPIRRPLSSDGAAASSDGSPAAHTAPDAHATSGGWVYRQLYDDARRRYAAHTHAAPCIRCGPSGRPAAVGSPWSKAHQHAAALRLVGKTILRDLWRAAEVPV
jgi:hypothetical protein